MSDVDMDFSSSDSLDTKRAMINDEKIDVKVFQFEEIIEIVEVLEESDEEVNKIIGNDNLLVFANCFDRVGWLDLYGKYRY